MCILSTSDMSTHRSAWRDGGFSALHRVWHPYGERIEANVPWPVTDRCHVPLHGHTMSSGHVCGTSGAIRMLERAISLGSLGWIVFYDRFGIGTSALRRARARRNGCCAGARLRPARSCLDQSSRDRRATALKGLVPRAGSSLLGQGGREVLAPQQREHTPQPIPVSVPTASADPCAIDVCDQAGAKSNIQKPVNFDRFMQAIPLLQGGWFEAVIWPKGGQVT
jgi:hypothetical protein